MAIVLKQSIADPVAYDAGNHAIQGRIVSKTMKFSLFTTNENAVWASSNQLIEQKKLPNET